jgi:hypothetical protein
MLPYIEEQLSEGARLHHVTRHMLGLYQGQYGGRQYRRHLSEHAHKAESNADTLRSDGVLCRAPCARGRPCANSTVWHFLRLTRPQSSL